MRRGVWIAITDILLIGVGLVIFALFHHVLPRAYEGELIQVVRPTDQPDILAALDDEQGAAQGGDGSDAAAAADAQVTDAAVQATPAPSGEASASSEPQSWRVKFAEKFSYGEAINTDTTYKSADISIEMTTNRRDNLVYYVADIYIADIDCLRAGLAQGKFGQGVRDDTFDIAKANDAILAISGDYYGTRGKGVVIRNGQVYRQKPYQDVCVLYYDGTMKTYTAKQFDVAEAIAGGAYQVWSFGPMLLNDGQKMTEFNSDVNPRNPRSAIGYYEPGHYCFVTVDGRTDNSDGMTLAGLSSLFYNLGCAEAYNLDGGETAVMVFDKKVYSEPADGGREVSDIIYIGEAAE